VDPSSLLLRTVDEFSLPGEHKDVGLVRYEHYMSKRKRKLNGNDIFDCLGNILKVFDQIMVINETKP
jgi:hypothetical protein